jgi:hypothetical protein
MLGLELLWRRVGVRRYWHDATVREAHHQVDDAGLDVVVPRQRSEADLVSLEEGIPAVIVAPATVDVSETVVDITEPEMSEPQAVAAAADTDAIRRLRRGDA